MLNRLVAPDARDGRVNLLTLDAELGHHTGKDYGSRLRRYLAGKEYPYALAAWHLGEELNRLGVDWSSGLAMVYAAGRLKDFVGTILSYVFREDGVPTDTDIVRLWLMVESLPDLLYASEYDLEPEFVGTHRTCQKVFGDVDIQLMDCLARLHASDDAELALSPIVAREGAKIHWTLSPDVRADFERAWSRRDDSKRWPAIAHAAMNVAASTDLPWSTRVESVHQLLVVLFEQIVPLEVFHPQRALDRIASIMPNK